MESNIKIKRILLSTIDDVSTLMLEDNTDIKLVLTNDQASDVVDFFVSLLNLLLEGEFNLGLDKGVNSPKIVEEVSDKYIDRLNKEINNILASEEYRLFRK